MIREQANIISIARFLHIQMFLIITGKLALNK